MLMLSIPSNGSVMRVEGQRKFLCLLYFNKKNWPFFRNFGYCRLLSSVRLKVRNVGIVPRYTMP